MATAMKECRVCGKLYPACHSLRRGDTTFRWQEVACSPECGAEYLRKITLSRSEEKPADAQNERQQSASTTRKRRAKKGDAQKAEQE